LEINDSKVAFFAGSKDLIQTDDRASRAWREIRDIFSSIDARAIKIHFDAHATTSTKSISTTLTSLTKDFFEEKGWSWNQPIFPGMTKSVASFFAVKSFDGLVVALDIGSRHNQQLLGKFLLGNLAVKVQGETPARLDIGMYFIAAYLENALTWGGWNGAVAHFDEFIEVKDLVAPILAHPTVLFGLEKVDDLLVETNLSGTLKLTVGF
jgi:hypothetical protein